MGLSSKFDAMKNFKIKWVKCNACNNKAQISLRFCFVNMQLKFTALPITKLWPLSLNTVYGLKLDQVSKIKSDKMEIQQFTHSISSG